MLNTPEAVFVDFHGTISNYTFWSSLPQQQYNQIQTVLFKKNDQLVREWMRGSVETAEIIRFVSNATGIQNDLLAKTIDREMENSIIPRETRALLARLALKLPVFLFSDNMKILADWFSQDQLSKSFRGYWFSSEYGYLKNDNSGESYKKVCHSNDIDLRKCVFLDDSLKSVETFSKLGGTAIHVENPMHTNAVLEEILIRAKSPEKPLVPA